MYQHDGHIIDMIMSLVVVVTGKRINISQKRSHSKAWKLSLYHKSDRFMFQDVDKSHFNCTGLHVMIIEKII